MYALKDFDWSRRVSAWCHRACFYLLCREKADADPFDIVCQITTLSSDKISSLRRPLLVLKLDVADDSEKEKEVVIELEESELKAFVSKLCAAQKVGRWDIVLWLCVIWLDTRVTHFSLFAVS
jgi:hypothetical protein